MNTRFEIAVFQSTEGLAPFERWLTALRHILRRIQRMTLGNFGDHKWLGDGIAELRIDHGPGYRVYFCQDGQTIVVLLCAGDKRTQTADIERAREYRSDYERRRR